MPPSMKPFRLFLAIAGVGGAAGLLGLGLAFTPAVQTWAVGRELAKVPGWSLRIEGATVRPGRIELRGLMARRGETTFRAPHAALNLPVWTVWRRGAWQISDLQATGWSLELAPRMPATEAAPDWLELIQASATFGPVARMLAWLPELGEGPTVPLPEWEIVRLQGAGTVRSGPAGPALAVTLGGGGLRPGQEARLAIVVRPREAAAAGAGEVAGELRLELGPARSLVRATLALDFAGGPTVPVWQARGEIRKNGGSEIRRWSVAGRDHTLLAVEGAREGESAGWRGSWRVALRPGEAKQLGLAEAWPLTNLAGSGDWETAPRPIDVKLTGRFEFGSDGREPWPGGWTGLGAISGTGDFSATVGAERLTWHEARMTMQAEGAAAAGLRLLQPLAVTWREREFHVADAGRDLLAVAAHGVPVRWLQPWLPPGWELRAGVLHGEFSGGVRSGGLALRSSAPLRVTDLEIGYKGTRRAADLAWRGFATADWSVHGWQWGLAEGTVTRGAAPVGTFEAKAGRLAGEGQPIKFTGSLGGSLPEWAGLAAGAGGEWAAGELQLKFDGQQAAQLELQVQGEVKGAKPARGENAEILPDLAAELRIDVDAAGRWAGSGPLLVGRAGRRSDVAVAGTLEPTGRGRSKIDLRLAGAHWHGPEVAAWATWLGEAATAAGAADWDGVVGLQAARLAGVLRPELGEAAVVLKFSGGEVAVESGAARLGPEGELGVSGRIRREHPAGPWRAELAVRARNVDPAPWAEAGQAPAWAEGKFDADAVLTGRAPTVRGLPATLGGEWQVTSRGGVFRGLATVVAGPTETPGRLAGILASAGSVLGGLTGRRDANDIAGRPEATAELGRALGAIRYDQLSFRVAESGIRGTVTEFSLISPELRLVGGGRFVRPEAGLLAAAELEVDLALRARGRTGDLLKYLGLPEGAADDLGYTASGLPVHLGGTVGRPEAGELGRRLSALAAEKSGVAEKASELINRIRGGK